VTDETTTAPATAPDSARPEPKTGKSGYRTAAAPVSAVDSRQNGGAGVQRSHLRNRKAWLKRRSRAGQSWSQRKVASLTYCPAKARAS
jgi:hypothetical protein